MTQVVYVQNSKSNGLGVASFVLSILGWLTCGILAPIAFLLSLLALIVDRPKGMAVAGFVISGVAMIPFFAVGLGLVIGILGLSMLPPLEVLQAQTKIEAMYEEAGALPDQPTGNAALEDLLGSGVVIYFPQGEKRYRITSAGTDDRLGTHDDVVHQLRIGDVLGDSIETSPSDITPPPKPQAEPDEPEMTEEQLQSLQHSRLDEIHGLFRDGTMLIAMDCPTASPPRLWITNAYIEHLQATPDATDAMLLVLNYWTDEDNHVGESARLRLINTDADGIDQIVGTYSRQDGLRWEDRGDAE